MFVQLLETFRDTRAATATFQAVFIGTMTCFCVVSGVLIRHYGIVRSTIVGTVLLSGGFILSFFATSLLMLNILVGVISGIGVSLLFISSTVLVGNSFEGRKREIALTVLQITMGIGIVLYPFLIKHLMHEYTVHGTFLILGGLFLNNGVLPVLTYNNKQLIEPSQDKHGRKTADVTSENNVTRKLQALQMFNNGKRQIKFLFNFRYTVVLVASGLVISSGNAYLIVFEDIFTWKECTPSDILRLWATFSSSGIVGRALPIVFSMVKPGDDMMLLLLSSAISACLGQVLLLLSSARTVAFAANVFAGFTQGCIISTTTVSIANISSKQSFGVAFGLFLTVDGVLSMALGPLYGFIRDKQRSYELVIALSAVVNAFSALMFAAAIMKTLYKRKTRMSQADVEVSL